MELEQHKGLPKSLLWMMTIMAGVIVANLYYNQPLLKMISNELNVPEYVASHMAVCTQVGYAVGLLFIIPLGDLYSRRHIVITCLALLALSLSAITIAPSMTWILPASLLTGICSVIPQVFVPITAQFSKPENTGRNVGIVMSGLLTGILLARVVSGMVGEYCGWRFMFGLAAAMMLVCAAVVVKMLPNAKSNYSGSYWGLMCSIVSLVRRYPVLRIASLRAGLAFGSMMAMWGCLAFRMEQSPFYANSDVVGALGICGVAGCLSASFVGKYANTVGFTRFNVIGALLQLLAWFCLSVLGNSYFGIIAGVLVIDIGMQCIQLSNQACIFELEPQSSNRINTVYMTTYFAGGSFGTFLASMSWTAYGWIGVVGVGVLLSVCSLLLNALVRKQ